MKTLTWISSLGVILAQADMPMPDWAKLSVSMACLSILGYVVIRTLPAMFERHLEEHTKMQGMHDATISKVVDAHRETSRRICDKLDQQTDALSRAILGQRPPRMRPHKPEDTQP